MADKSRLFADGCRRRRVAQRCGLSPPQALAGKGLLASQTVRWSRRYRNHDDRGHGGPVGGISRALVRVRSCRDVEGCCEVIGVNVTEGQRKLDRQRRQR